MKICKKLQTDSYVLKLDKLLKGEMISTYDSIMLTLIKKLGNHHPCQYAKCMKYGQKKHMCKGCKCCYYCSKKCQKRDWKTSHRKICVSRYSTTLNLQQMETMSQFQQMVKHLFTK